MSKRKNVPAGLPPIPAEMEPESPPEVIEPEMTVEAATYQTEQETVQIVFATCPRCGSTERTPLKEITPRIYTDRGCIIRYRTQCRGLINPVDKDGKPVVDADGKPVSYECGNRYKVKKLVPKNRKSASWHKGRFSGIMRVNLKHCAQHEPTHSRRQFGNHENAGKRVGRLNLSRSAVFQQQEL